MLGTKLGTCTLERLIGQGGMGSVYLAKQSSPQRYVAVKVLQAQSGSTRRQHIQRFQHEANVIAQLEHINIIPIFEYGEQDTILYLVMPYIGGGNMRQELTRQGKFSVGQAMYYLQQITAALTYAHAHGIVHRDLKPANMLLHADRRLVLADFGIAHTTAQTIDKNAAYEPLTHAGDVLGTSAYMAPEQVLGKPVSPQTDIYTLGIIFFEMLSGEVPFKGNTDFILQNQHIHNPLPALHKLNPALPAAVDIVLQKATAKEQSERYSSAGALFQALHHALYDQDWTATRDMYAFTQFNQPLAVPETTLQIQKRNTDGDSLPVREKEYSAIAAKEVTALPTRTTPEPTHKSFPRRHWLKFLFLSGATFILLGGFVLGLQVAGVIRLSPPAPTPVSAPMIGRARQVVRTYYADINKHHYPAAYALLTNSFQQSLSLNAFENSYLSTVHATIISISSQVQSDGSIIVSVTINALEEQNTGEIHHVYNWQGTVIQQNGRPRISAAQKQDIS